MLQLFLYYIALVKLQIGVSNLSNYNECVTENTCENYKWMEIFIAVIWGKPKENMYVHNDSLRSCHLLWWIHSFNPFFQIALKTELAYIRFEIEKRANIYVLILVNKLQQIPSMNGIHSYLPMILFSERLDLVNKTHHVRTGIDNWKRFKKFWPLRVLFHALD